MFILAEICAAAVLRVRHQLHAPFRGHQLRVTRAEVGIYMSVHFFFFKKTRDRISSLALILSGRAEKELRDRPARLWGHFFSSGRTEKAANYKGGTL